MKKVTFIYSIILILIVLLSFWYIQSIVTNIEQQIVEQKALTISMAIYADTRSYLKEVCNDEVYEYVLHALENHSGKLLDKISISYFYYDKTNDTYNVGVGYTNNPN